MSPAFHLHLPQMPDIPDIQALCLAAAPAVAALGALACGRGLAPARAWACARIAMVAWCAAAAANAVALFMGGGGSAWGVRADVPGAAALLLVGFISWVIVRYAQTCLAGEPQQVAGARWLLATLAGVGLVVVGNHLLLMAAAWLGTSAALQRLLTYYSQRPAALLAAHKKRVTSRLADVMVFAAVALIAGNTDTFAIDEAMRVVAATPVLPWTLQAAAVLMAGAAILKCAQLPFHGWLIQVMEAPTPVSALLHAGVVNLGALVLIRLAVLMSAVPAAQALLVVVGSCTAVLAALVMSTRISVKVSLAWSTCAQLGFMLVQCGLGAYELALLHLLAHSLYKAHAFLDSGGTVHRSAVKQSAPPAASPSAWRAAAAAIGGTAVAALAAWAAGWGAEATPSAWLLLAIGGASMGPLLSAPAAAPRGAWLAAAAGSVVLVAVALAASHGLAEMAGLDAHRPHGFWLAWVGLSFSGLFALQAVLATWPQGRWAQALYPWFYGGLYLDERVSRWVFRIWPLPHSERPLA
jgi:NAD(P)H-quinone oxidoreductase subunit 5